MDAVSLFYARLVFTKAQPIYELHRDLCRAFDARRCDAYLFRTDVDRQGRQARRVVLVQSSTPGDWSKLDEMLASREARPEPHLWRLAEGQRFRFFLRANVTQSKKAKLRELAGVRGEAYRERRGKRIALRGDVELEKWLRRQGERHGFRLVETPFAQDDGTSKPVAALRISAGRDADWRAKERRGHHAGVDFEGLLQVADGVRLGDALARGIGPAKAFGFGLLSLAAAP